jgi:membrane protease YdiL (CAAX protease family)
VRVPLGRLATDKNSAMGTPKHIRKKIVAFLLLTFAISSVFYYLMISTGSARNFVLGWMWSPGVAAILTQLLFGGKLRDFGWGLGRVRYLLLGYAIPLLYALVIYSIVWITGLGGFHPQSPVRLLLYVVLGTILASVAALGEEIGWRGLLVPEMARITTYTKTALVSGIVWAVWHYPAIIFADYNSVAPLWFNLTTFTVSVLGMSFFAAWLRLKTGSLWPATLWHGSHNLFVQQVFLSLTIDSGVTEYIVDDFGIGLTLAVVVLAYVFWRKRAELPDVLHREVSEAPTEQGVQPGQAA